MNLPAKEPRTVHITRLPEWRDSDDENDKYVAICSQDCYGVLDDIARLSSPGEMCLAAHEHYCEACLKQLDPIEHLNLVDL